MGKGLGSAFGTSVPFFLADYARPPLGIESEYGRLLLEEGLPGLLLWVGFVVWLLASSARKVRSGSAERVGMWAVIASYWASGLLGAGVLSSIPGTLLLMIYMGSLARTSEQVVRRPQLGLHPVTS
jgi:O-antigen ligase